MPDHAIPASHGASDSSDANTIVISPFNYREAGDEQFHQLADFLRAMAAESEPDDPPQSDEDATRMLRHLPSFYRVDAWQAKTPSAELVAFAWALTILTEENQHLMQFSIEVLRPYRRQGIGRRCLRAIFDDAVSQNRRLMIANTTDRVPAGQIFLERVGATAGVVSRINQLRMSELNRPLLSEWLKRAETLEAHFELGFWDGAYPEEELEAIAQLTDVMNQAPHDELEIEDIHMTPAMLREEEKVLLDRGSQRRTYYARERATGAFAGFTDLFVRKDRPAYAQVGSTGVFPAYRNHGLGRWLKAAMTDFLLREHPEVEYVRTQNANSNAPMRRINEELGFKLYRSETVWQVETDKLRRYLAE